MKLGPSQARVRLLVDKARGNKRLAVCPRKRSEPVQRIVVKHLLVSCLLLRLRRAWLVGHPGSKLILIGGDARCLGTIAFRFSLRRLLLAAARAVGEDDY